MAVYDDDSFYTMARELRRIAAMICPPKPWDGTLPMCSNCGNDGGVSDYGYCCRCQRRNGHNEQYINNTVAELADVDRWLADPAALQNHRDYLAALLAEISRQRALT